MFLIVIYLFILAEKTTYEITVETGDVSGAGTDANVYITLYGEKEDSGETTFYSLFYFVIISLLLLFSKMNIQMFTNLEKLCHSV